MIDNLEKYRENSIRTQTKGELLLTLYDEAIKKLTHGKILIENKDYENASNALDKVIEIFSYLSNTLDYSQNAELAEQLENLYGFFIRETIKAISLKSTKEIDELLIRIRDLRATWEEADRIARTEK